MTSITSDEYNSEPSTGGAFFSDDDGGLYTIKCKTGLVYVGLQTAEAECTPVRVICTLVAVSVVSGWFNRRHSIKNLLLFFGHWLSGLTHLLALMCEASMIMVCAVGEESEGIFKVLKFIEQVSSNMFVSTNLAICVNLALIVVSHRTLSTVRTARSSVLLVVSLVVSVSTTSLSVIYWEQMIILGTLTWPYNSDESIETWVTVSTYVVQFIVGISMLLIILYLLVFRMDAVKGCWVYHARIRYYFGLTVIGTIVNLALGIFGTTYLIDGSEKQDQIVFTWCAHYVHIALVTIVLYGVLGVQSMDESASSTDTTEGRLEVGPIDSLGPKRAAECSSTSTTNQRVSFHSERDESDHKALAPVKDIDPYFTPSPTGGRFGKR